MNKDDLKKLNKWLEKSAARGDWEKVADGAPFEAELERELSPGHALRGIKPKALAKSSVDDDVLFALKGEGYAVIHLTYSDNTLPEWPNFRQFRTGGEVIEYLDETAKG